jgi:hypothetical protein
MFVGIDKYITNHENAFVERTAYISDIKSIATLSGRRKNKASIRIFNLKYNIDKNITTADAFIKFAENLLTDICFRQNFNIQRCQGR